MGMGEQKMIYDFWHASIKIKINHLNLYLWFPQSINE